MAAKAKPVEITSVDGLRRGAVVRLADGRIVRLESPRLGGWLVVERHDDFGGGFEWSPPFPLADRTPAVELLEGVTATTKIDDGQGHGDADPLRDGTPRKARGSNQGSLL